MQIADLAAQLIMIDLPDAQLSAACRAHLENHAWGGVILFARNIQDRLQLLELMQNIEATASAASPPLLAVDQEGGLVDRVRFDDYVLTPGAMALAATGDPQATRRAHYMMGKQLNELGFHLDFAPCADINSNADNPVIGVRSFGEVPERVAEHTVAASLGLREGGVWATAKHFPGHGDCSIDSHLALPTLSHELDTLRQREFVPFKAAVQAGVEAMMTAHITFPALDSRPGRPATLSEPILNGLLRQELGFEGVIFSDSLEMQAIADHFGSGEATVLAIEAGCDMVICCGGFAEHQRALAALVEAVQNGRLSENRLRESVERIKKVRQGVPEPVRQVENQHLQAFSDEMRQIIERSITLVRNDQDLLPLRGSKVCLLSPDMLPLTPLGEMTSSESVLRHLNLEGVELTELHYSMETRGPALDHLLAQVREADTVLFTVYARHRLPDAVREFGQHLLQANARTVLVSLSSPYVLRDLPEAAAFVCSYNYTPLSLTALGKVLTGALLPQGQLPVNIPGLYPVGHGLSYSATPR